MKETIIKWMQSYYIHNSVLDTNAWEDDKLLWTLGLVAALFVTSFIVWIISRFVLVSVIHKIAIQSNASWDDHFVNNKVFKGLALLVPLMFMESFLSITFFDFPTFLTFTDKLVLVLIILTMIIVANRSFNAIKDVLLSIESFKDKPIQSYTQILKIIVSGVLIVSILSVITDKSPIFFLTSLGAISAILLLIFRDTILGFVGSIQMAAYDMIRIGDWVTIEKYGADGEVEEITLTTVKVRNFDRTITTIPTYSLISDSFKNWRGMEESAGRRIKRSVQLQLDSVKFASPELLEKLKEIPSLTNFIEIREAEIAKSNKKNGFVGNTEIYGRRQTNLGLFRNYIQYYLSHSQEINQDMTLMVRQKEASEHGVPLEIYCFTKNKQWEMYETVQADLFDHIFAITPQFELRIFERPAGHDFKNS